MIKNIEKISPTEDILEGDFKSLIFMGEDDTDELSVYIENSSLIQYAEDCVNHFNNMPDAMVSEICQKIIEVYDLIDSFENPRDVLQCCWFASLSVIPENNGISYIVEGEGDWGESVIFAIKNGIVSYVGDDIHEGGQYNGI